MREILVIVHGSTGQASQPVLRFSEQSGIGGMGASFVRLSEDPLRSMTIKRFNAPPDARQMTVDVGVADGDWRSMLTFKRHKNQQQFGASQSGGSAGSWEGAVRTTDTTGDAVPLSFRYTSREDFETRLVYEQADGSFVKLNGQGSEVSHGLVNSLTTLPVSEFETIRSFHVQARPYQWATFHNVSLQLGHRTNVDVESKGVPASLLPVIEQGILQKEPAGSSSGNNDAAENNPGPEQPSSPKVMP